MSDEKITITELEAELVNYYGTERYYKGGALFPNMVYTDGVNAMAKRVGAYWLVDLVFSYQNNENPAVVEAPFQIWTLKVNADNTAVVTCKEDTNQPVLVEQEIEYTDFPVTDEFKLYFIDGVCLLPSEY